MARTLNRLKARSLDTLTKPGRHADGGNLYLAVSPAGARSWVFLYRSEGGRRTELGLGSLRDVSLARARELATEARQKVANGESPRPGRGAPGEKSFQVCVEHLIARLRPSWRSAIHARQWEDTLRMDAARLLPLPVDRITTEDVLGVLSPMWQSKRTTAERLRGRIERVLDSARARDLITSPWENPARWRGHLDHILGKRTRVEQPHHAALPFEEVPTFLAKLRSRESIGARALEFAILTAARSGEVIGARWSEIDLNERTWIIPGERMKSGRSHRVPLSRAALAILKPLHEARESEFVFPGQTAGTPLGRNALGRAGVPAGNTVHGFRSSFRDWASEATSFPHEVCEQALAHTIGSAVERAYRRGDLFEKRRQLMEAWGEFCAAERGTVLAFQGRH